MNAVRVFETIAVAFSMFSALPMPQFEWNQRNMRFALVAFPLIGVVIGALCGLIAWGGGWLSLPQLLIGVLLGLAPVAVTGGIHLDGACDTWDALASHAAPERKQEILKDSHVGSFALIRLGCYLALYLALWITLPHYRYLPLGLMFCLSRVQSGLAVATFPLAKKTGLAYTFATAADRKRVAVVLTVLDVLLSLALVATGWQGLAMAVAAQCVFVWYRRMALRQFGGLSGDLAGWFVQTVELWMLIALYAVQIVEGLL